MYCELVTCCSSKLSTITNSVVEPRRLGTQLEMQATPAEHFTSVCLNGTHSRNTIALAHKMETTKTQTNGNEHDLIRALLTLITLHFKLRLSSISSLYSLGFSTCLTKLCCVVLSYMGHKSTERIWDEDIRYKRAAQKEVLRSCQWTRELYWLKT